MNITRRYLKLEDEDPVPPMTAVQRELEKHRRWTVRLICFVIAMYILLFSWHTYMVIVNHKWSSITQMILFAVWIGVMVICLRILRRAKR